MMLGRLAAMLLLPQRFVVRAQGFGVPPPPPAPPSALDCMYTPDASHPDVYYDLSLAEAALEHDLTFDVSGGGGTINARICRKPVLWGGTCNGHSCESQPCIQDAAGMIVDKQQKCAATGSLDSFQWSLQTPSNPRGGAQLTYQNGDGSRSMTMVFQCDWSVNSPQKGAAVESPALHYKVTVITSGACVLAPGPLSWGWITLILLLVALVVYCVGGGVYNYKYRGEEGLNIIPQWAYWKTLPGLVKDGCIYSYRHGGRTLKNAPRDIKECWNGRNTKELREPIAYTAATE